MNFEQKIKTKNFYLFYRITPPKDLKGPLEINNLLDNAERLFEGRIYGPEHLLARGDDIFTTIHGGEVIKINGDHITHVAKFGEPCGLFFFLFFVIYL